MENLTLSDCSDMSDFEEILTPDELSTFEWVSNSSASPGPARGPGPAADKGRHPPWSGHRDRLVGIVDMGRCETRLTFIFQCSRTR